MATPTRDVLSITTADGKAFDRWTSFETVNSIVRSSEASFEIGDDGSWDDFSEIAALGVDVFVSLNGRPRMKGKVELLNSPLTVAQSSVMRFVVRTVIADLEVQTADPRIRFDTSNNAAVTIGSVVDKTLLLAGVQADTFIFGNNASRNLMTGTRVRGAKPDPSLEPLTLQQAAVQPGETVKVFLDRHLRRHGLLMFDGPNGEIVIAAPDQDQEESYTFQCYRAGGTDNRFNNLTEIDRTQDATGAPSEVWVLGQGGGKDAMRQKLGAFQRNPTLFDAGFIRTVMVVDEGVKTKEFAQRSAARLMSEALRRQDSITLSTDGLTFLKGRNRINFAPDTTAQLVLDTMGAAVGKFYVESVVQRSTVDEGNNSQLSLVRAGTWVL